MLFKIKRRLSRPAFTLLEILLVIAALAILATIVIIAINPNKTLTDINNSSRLMDLRSIDNALTQYAIDHDGYFPASIDNNLRIIGSSDANCQYFFNEYLGASHEHCLDLEPYLVPNYLTAIPFDPKIGDFNISYYGILRNSFGNIEIYSYLLELETEEMIQYTLSYEADQGGTLIGSNFQTVFEGGSGSEIFALAAENYIFSHWSDGVTDNPRVDIDVKENIEVIAFFVINNTWQSCGDEITFLYRDTLVSYNTIEGQNGTCWLDRNLGASRAAIERTDSESFGHLFQWGRADDGHQLRNSEITEILSSSDDPFHSLFIINPNSPGDWRISQNNSLWQGHEGINNPCPSGWRLPYESELQAERLSWTSNDRYGAFNSPLKWPSSGYRGSNGSLVVVSNFGYAWSSSTHNTNARTLAYISNNAYVLSYNRSLGFPVRCIMD